MRRFLMLFFSFLVFLIFLGFNAGLKTSGERRGETLSTTLVPCVCVQSNYNGGSPTQNVRVCVATTNPDPDSMGGGANWIGDFVEGDLSGRDLLYNYRHRQTLFGVVVDPLAPRPWSSWVAFKIDGVIYNIRDFYYTGLPILDTSPYVRGDSIFTVWRVGSVYITQKISPRQINGPGTATMLYEWIVENGDAVAHNVGLLVQFDTMINENDATRISTVFGYINREQEFLAPNIPTYWQAWENDDLSGMVAQGDLIGPEATMPDRVCIGGWPTYYLVDWDYTPTFGTYDDSAVLIWFNPRTVPAGGTLRFGTYYGIGRSVVQSGLLRLNLNPVRLNCARCGEISPNPFDLVLLVTNTYYSLFGDNTAYNVQATITYPTSCLTMVGGSSPQYTTPRNLAGPILPGYEGETGSVSWRFLVNPDCMGDSVCFDIRVTNTNPNIPANTIRYCTYIPICTGVHPTARFIRVDPCSLVTSCAYQDVVIHFTRGLAPINPNSIQLWVNGTIYTIASSGGQLTFAGDDLRFLPSNPWRHGDTVGISLISAYDDSGCAVEPVTCGFIVDIMPPLITNEQPANGSVINISNPIISVDIYDGPAGVAPSAINVSNTVVRVNGVPVGGYSLSWDGLTLQFTGLTFRSGDTVEVCINDMWDDPDYTYCPPNHIQRPYCWNFIVRMNPPVAEFVLPRANAITACDPQDVVIRIVPGDAPIDTNSILLRVNGVLYTIASPELFMQNDTTLIFRPSAGHFSNGDLVVVTLESLRDVNGISALDLPLTLQYTVDLLPPALISYYPQTNVSITNPQPIIWATFWDGVSGFNPDHINITINGITRFDLRSPALRVSGDTVYFDPSAISFSFSDNETVSFCVDSVMDSPDYCGPNIATYCWTFFVNYIGPVSSVVVPQPNAISACNPQQIALRIFDLSGVDTNSILLSINGVLYTINSLWLYFRNDSLYFDPPENFFRNGEIVNVSLDSVCDIWGIPGTSLPLRWSFIMDYQPPIITPISPLDRAIVTTPTPEIVFSVYDSISGVNADSIFVQVNERLFSIGSVGVSWDGRNIRINTSRAGMSFADGETVVVCAYAIDRPTLCGPNRARTCWGFTINLSPPQAYILEPLQYTFSSCRDQNIIMRLFDPDGINVSSIVLRVNGSRYTIGASLTYINDTLRFVPPTYWANGETIEVCLDSVADNLGNWLPTPICWDFYIDLAPPYMIPIEPYPSQFVNNSTQIIRLIINDSLSGLDTRTLMISVDGRLYRLGETGINFVGGETLIFNPGVAGVQFDDGDTIYVCVNAADTPDYCPPNELDSCYSFYVRLRGPIGSILEPLPGSSTACGDQRVVMLVQDDDFPVDWASLRIEIQGNIYTIDSSGITYRGDTLIWQPYAPVWSNNETVFVSLLEVDDSLGNHLQEMVSWWFVVDLVPPYVSSAVPGNMDFVGTSRPTVRFTVDDDISGVDLSSVRIRVNGNEFDISSRAFWNLGNSFFFSADSAGMRFYGGDTVQFCVVADDDPDYCPPNELDTCWSFIIITGGPYPEIVRPMDNTYSACSPESIIFTLTDDDGIVADSIHFIVRRGPGGTVVNEYYGIGYPEIRWDGRTLVFVPAVPFADGETVYVTILNSRDSLMNEMNPRPLSWRFVMDLSAPVITHITGGPGFEYVTRRPLVSFVLLDSLSGVQSSGVSITINGLRYGIGSMGIVVRGDTLTWDASLAGMTFSGGDTIDICVHAEDMPDYCSPNILDTCWNVLIQSGGPIGSIVRPFDGAYSSCVDERIIIYLTDPQGVIPATIVLVVNGDTIRNTSPGFAYRNDTLYYSPSRAFGDSEFVRVELVAAEDSLGNRLETSLVWNFQMDRIPPSFETVGWGCGDTLVFRSPRFTFFVRDDLSGLDSGVVIRINGTRFDTSSAAFYWNGDTLVFDTGIAGYAFSGGDSVLVCLSAYDMPDYCEPNLVDTCCTVYILPGGPVVTVVRPLNNTYSACLDEHILILIQDDDGVVDSTIRFMVVRGQGGRDTLRLSIFDDGVYFVGGESLFYYPPTPFAPNETVYVAFLYAEDILGNRAVSYPRWRFVMDMSAPLVISMEPAYGSYVDTRSPDICLTLIDSLSGIRPESLRVSIDGVWYSYDNPSVTYSSGRLCVSTAGLGLSWSGGDTVHVCAHAVDRPDYCEPNQLDTCLFFVISPGGPVASIIMPLPDSTSSCEDQQIWISIRDTNGVNPATIRLEVMGIVYDISSPELDFRSDTLFWRPPTGHWDYQGWVDVRLLAADDNLGNPLTGAPLVWRFMLDFDGPYSVYAYPPLDTITFDWQQDFAFVLADSLREVYPRSVSVYIDRLFGVGPAIIRYGDRGFYWFNDTIRIVPESLAFEFDIEDSHFVGGYFAEFDTIEIRVHTATDIPPFYCEPNEFEGGQMIRFYVADDDTSGPIFSNFAPGLAYENTPFNLTVVITDESGIYDDETGSLGQGIYIRWDDDGELLIDYDGEGELYIDSVLNSSSVVARTIFPIGGYPAGRTILIMICAYDNDFDFFNFLDRTQSCSTFTVRVLEGPRAEPVEPLPGTFTSCDDQRIIIHLHDLEGVDSSTIRLDVNGVIYTIDSPELAYRNDSLIFTSSRLWENAETVSVTLVSAQDIYGAPLVDTLEYMFVVDLFPPTYSLDAPSRTMIRENQPIIEISIVDSLAGVDDSSIVLTINGEVFRYPRFSVIPLEPFVKKLIFNSMNNNLKFRQGDTVRVTISACDSPNYCPPNCSDFSFVFVIEPAIACLVHPNPFTPNEDGYNDFTVFSYPYMFSETAELYIYNKNNIEVFRATIPPVTDFRDVLGRTWYGLDKNKNRLKEGVYLYIIKVGGEVVCNGTVVIAK